VRHSSTRDVDVDLVVGLAGVAGDISGDPNLAGEITVLPPKSEPLCDRSGEAFLAGLMTVPPPNNEAMVAVFGAIGGVFGNGYSSREACSDFHRVNLLISAASPSTFPHVIMKIPSPAPFPSSPPKSTSKLLRMFQPSHIFRKWDGRYPRNLSISIVSATICALDKCIFFEEDLGE